MVLRKNLLVFIMILKLTTQALRVSPYVARSSLKVRTWMSSAGEVVIKAGKAKLFWGGNPLIYSGAVDHVLNAPQAGEEVSVVDTKGNSIGRGYYNPHSQYRVRLMVGRDEQRLMNMELEEVICKRIEDAKGLRRACGLPNEHTSAYRLVNGEGDRLSGLVVDVLGRAVVVQSSAYWVEANRDVVERAVRSCLAPGQVMIWRRAESRLNRDGWDVDEDEDEYFKYGEEGKVSTDIDDVDLSRLHVSENGIRYEVNALDGQKTGFYCDQRDNRELIRRYVQGRRVLDAYCYTGGFTLNCLLGGADHVTAVDSSNPALQLARRNVELNGFDPTDNRRVRFIKGDAVKEMKQLSDEGERFDVVIADPPKLAPSRNSLDRAKKKYVQVNLAALRLVKPGGLLLTHSCSGAVTQQQLLPSLVLDASRQLGRQITLLSTSNAAPCHPVHMAYRESAYLTALLFHVS